MANLQKLFGKHLREARKARGLTQSELAERVERSLDMIGRLERGEIAPSFETIERLTFTLKVQPAELFGGASAITNPTADELQAALAQLEAMPPVKLKQALGVLKAL